MLNIREYEAVTKLSLSEEERRAFCAHAETLIGGFAALETVDTENVPPLVSVLELNNILREDRAEKLISRDELLSNAPEHSEGYFRVPGTLE